MTGVLIVGGFAASAGLGYFLCWADSHGRIRELEQALASSREFCRGLAHRQLHSPLRPPRPPTLNSGTEAPVDPWPAPDPEDRITETWPPEEPLRPLSEAPVTYPVPDPPGTALPATPIRAVTPWERTLRDNRRLAPLFGGLKARRLA